MCLMWSFDIVFFDVFSYSNPQGSRGQIFIGVDSLGFQTSEPSLYDNIINPTALAIHALADVCDKGTGLLTTLLIQGNQNLMWIYIVRQVRKKGASGIYHIMMRND